LRPLPVLLPLLLALLEQALALLLKGCMGGRAFYCCCWPLMMLLLLLLWTACCYRCAWKTHAAQLKLALQRVV
jgi:hypothetical protein